MCMKTPKPKKVKEEVVHYLANPFLDGMAINRQGAGRDSLRIDRAKATVVLPGVTPDTISNVVSDFIVNGPGSDTSPGGGLTIPTAPSGATTASSGGGGHRTTVGKVKED